MKTFIKTDIKIFNNNNLIASTEIQDTFNKIFQFSPDADYYLLKGNIFRIFREHDIFATIHRRDNHFTEDKLKQRDVYVYDIIFNTVFGLQNITNFDRKHSIELWGDGWNEILPSLYWNTYEEAENACIKKVFDVLLNFKYIKKHGIKFPKEFMKHFETLGQ